MSNKNKRIKPQETKKTSSDKNKYIIIAAVVVVAIVVAIVFAITPKNNNDDAESVSSSERIDQLQGIVDSAVDEAEKKQEQEEEQAQDQSAEESDEYNITSASDFEPAYYADINIEDYGTITVALDEKDAPISVKNFVDLASDGFYDGLTFHRIMSGFMMQGGDPEGNGTGGSDENIKGEFRSNGVDNPLSHKRGAISMARSGEPDSASSQFFIVHQDSEFLDGEYACFGYVTDGMDVVDAVCEESEPTDNNGTIPSDKQPVIKSIDITVVN